MKRRDDGQSTVEFALMLPLFILLLAALLDVASLARAQLLVDGVARDAARVASTARTADEAYSIVSSMISASGFNVASFESSTLDGIIRVRVFVEPRTSSIVGVARWLGNSHYLVGEASFVTEFDIEAR